MTDTSALTSVVANRYAGSLFELAEAAKSVDAVEKELDSLAKLIAESDDFSRLLNSPVFSSQDQINAIESVAAKAGLNGKGAAALVGNFLRVVATNRRLDTLPDIIRAFHHLAAEARGEITAEVVSATALTAAQQTELKAVLKNIASKDVALKISIDPDILGGLVVRMGSRQIDTSLRTRLSSLKLALKEVG